MRERITDKMLEIRIDYLNKITGNEQEAYTRTEKGQYKANPGNYHLSGAYGGKALNQMCNEGGGVHDVFNRGHMPKRELFDRLTAFISGIEVGKNT